MRLAIATALAVLVVAPAAAQNQTTFRNSTGQITGTATTDSNGTVTFRDGRGSTTGTATKSGNTTTFRDARGSTTGTATGPRR